MVLDDNDLIQSNATIISGVLILLTLTSLSGTFVTDSSSSLPLLDKLMIASAIIPFIASTLLLLNLRLNEAKRSDYARRLTV
jgi:hypothetical protein